jgi:hypothetical protein
MAGFNGEKPSDQAATTVDALAELVRETMYIQIDPSASAHDRALADAKLDRVLTANPSAAVQLQQRDGALRDVQATMEFMGTRLVDFATEPGIFEED